MKETRYMIGDILMAHFDDGESEFDFPIVVDGVDENGTLVDGTCYLSWYPLLKEHKDIEYAEDISPIPLTDEILKANGFVCDGEDEEGNTSYSLSLKKGAYQAKYYVWGYFTKQGFDIVFGANNQPCEIYLCYVHELQHALRLCGLNDLADNFKLK